LKAAVATDLWQEIKSVVGNQKFTGFIGHFYEDLDFNGPVRLTKVIPRLKWHDGGEASVGGNFRATQYSVRLFANFTATRNETLTIKLAAYNGVTVTFGDYHRVGDNGKVNVTAGVTYPITVEYFHGVGETRLEVAVTRPLENDRPSLTAKAASVDAIVFVGGLTAALEGEESSMDEDGFFRGDRTEIELPKAQWELLDFLKTLGRPIIFVICAGSAIAFNNTGLSAVLNAFYPGEAGGLAVADVIMGDYNPAGRLPITFYTATSELANFTDYNMSAGKGRTYRYYTGTPLYPFGHGLSYTTFSYSKPKVLGNPSKGESVTVKFGVRNTGSRSGDEVMQVYVTAHRAGEPIKALKWFKRQHFEPTAVETTIEAVLQPSAFAVFDDKAVGVGKYTIWVGGSSGVGLQVIDVEFKDSKKPRVWIIVGIAIGAVVLISAIIAVVCILRKRRKSALEQQQPPSLLSGS
jgi:beta-glucosidase